MSDFPVFLLKYINIYIYIYIYITLVSLIGSEITLNVLPALEKSFALYRECYPTKSMQDFTHFDKLPIVQKKKQKNYTFKCMKNIKKNHKKKRMCVNKPGNLLM